MILKLTSWNFTFWKKIVSDYKCGRHIDQEQTEVLDEFHWVISVRWIISFGVLYIVRSTWPGAWAHAKGFSRISLFLESFWSTFSRKNGGPVCLRIHSTISNRKERVHEIKTSEILFANSALLLLLQCKETIIRSEQVSCAYVTVNLRIIFFLRSMFLWILTIK